MHLLIGLKNFPLRSKKKQPSPCFEFHILSDVRKKYQFDETLYSISGNVIFANFQAVRVFAKKMNDQRDLAKHPERAVHAGPLNAMGLIDEINHFMIRRYEETVNPGIFAKAMAHLSSNIGKDRTESSLLSFSTSFPSQEVYRQGISSKDYLAQISGGKPNREIVLEELILLWFANINPAFSPFHELFDDAQMRKATSYTAIIETLQTFFGSEKPTGSGGQSMFELLREPMLASPHSLEGQLAYMRKHWGMMLSQKFIDKIAGAGDLIKEETKKRFEGGERPALVPTYQRNASGNQEVDQERFTTDLEWMPNVILLAKNMYVWLDQLSKKYGRGIHRLDEIPDEELDQLARWNITGLWLIGIWERSSASQTIKRMMGNPEAVASAYSLYDCEIAHDVGGEEAFQNLRSRAWQRGIRLAGDMVPNHVGLYSKWVIEHPEYFIQSDHSPFPNYQFTGVNLSSTPGVELRLEDGYWTKRDAAVVFQRVETGTGNVRYLYHGNDGTSMPWNDTAQLDFLKTEVREAVMQMIFHVARKFSIIRFDAAMVLAKKHFQRLWYPEPGSGGDIPSRADFAMSKEAFDYLFPVEFWREVVDRINREMPNTLLLAEAFWLLEGYFVRTLGMHRVYNSAFMHMMMKEENVKYRELIRNTLAFNPEILKRYVNFMSNPDERTSVDQFGKDDKYFGVAMMMVTMPGLPMFGHGQIEGYTEKYGMEYKKAYYDEHPDEHLIARHEREIFPMLKQRWLFSQVAHFELFDFHDQHGGVNEQVFVYCNRNGNERSLFCYNNKYESVTGTVGRTVLKVNLNGVETKGKTVGEALELNHDEKYFYVLYEHRSGLHFIRSGKELCEGSMHLSLRGFEYQLFLNFREVVDDNGRYARLAHHLKGGGVSDVNRALRELQLKPLHEALRALSNEETIAEMSALFSSSTPFSPAFDNVIKIYAAFIREVKMQTHAVVAAFVPIVLLGKCCATVRDWFNPDFRKTISVNSDPIAEFLDEVMPDDRQSLKQKDALLTAWMFTRNLYLFSDLANRRTSAQMFEEFLLDTVFEETSLRLQQPHWVAVLKSLLTYEAEVFALLHDCRSDRLLLLLNDPVVQQIINTNTHKGITYFHKEQFEFLMNLCFFVTVLGMPLKMNYEVRETMMNNAAPLLRQIKTLAGANGYELQKFKEHLQHHSLLITGEHE